MIVAIAQEIAKGIGDLAKEITPGILDGSLTLESFDMMNVSPKEKAFVKAIQTIMAVSGAECDIDISIADNQFSLSTRPGTEESDGTVGSSSLNFERVEFEDTDLIVKARDLLDAVEASDGEKVTFTMPENEVFVVVKDERNWLQLFTTVTPT